MDPTTQRILRAAAALFTSGTEPTISAVARHAGVARGTVYRRYPDRDALLTALATERGIGGGPRGSTRARILDALGEILRAQGLGGLTIEAVATRGDVGEATIYRHFGDRAGLVMAYAAERSPRATAPDLLQGTPEEALTGLARAGLAFAADHGALLQESFFAPPGQDPLLDRMRQGQGSARRALVGWIRDQVAAGTLRPGDPEAMARTFLALLFGLHLQGERGESAAALAVQTFLAGWEQR